MRVIEYELLLDEERKPVLVKKNSEFSDADEFLDSPSKIAQMFMVGCNAEYLPEEHIWMLALNVKCKPIGMFEVAHGTNRNCMTSPRELFVRRDVLKLIEDIKCDDGIPKNYGTLLDIMRKIRALPAADILEKAGLLSKSEEGKGH